MVTIVNVTDFTFICVQKNDTQEIIQNTSHLLLCMHGYEQKALVIDCNENIWNNFK